MSVAELAAGIVCGVLSGLGIGGGTALMVWMTAVCGMEQMQAQGINLLYFIPTAICAVLLHAKNHLICGRVVLPATLAGVLTAGLTAWIASSLEVELLRRLFGGFLIFVGLRELLGKHK